MRPRHLANSGVRPLNAGVRQRGVDAVEVLTVIALFALAPVAFLYPIWRNANSRHSEPKLVLFLPAFAALLWLGLVIALGLANIKGASLSNLIVELPMIVLGSSIVVVARLQLIGPDAPLRPKANALSVTATVIVVLLVRGFVPELGE